jgi:hypothetical protein
MYQLAASCTKIVADLKNLKSEKWIRLWKKHDLSSKTRYFDLLNLHSIVKSKFNYACMTAHMKFGGLRRYNQAIGFLSACDPLSARV